MDTKFSNSYWDDPRVIELDAEAKLAGAWMLTNARLNFAGYATVSLKTFRFQTEVDDKALGRAIEGLGKSCVRTPEGYWLRNFIRRQIGEGGPLVRNFMCAPLLRDMLTMPREVVELVLEEYPELRLPFDELKALPSPSDSPYKGLPKHKSREEKRRAEQSRAEQRVGGAGGRESQPRGFTVPAEYPEPTGSRMIAVGALKRRGESDAWSPAEVEAFTTAGLGELSDADFAAQLKPMRRYYGAVIPRGNGLPPDRRRLEVLTLLEHWSGELDKAKAYEREQGEDGLKHAN